MEKELGIKNGIIMQYFQNNVSSEVKVWRQVFGEAANLAELGVTAMWIPVGIGENSFGLLDANSVSDKNSIEFIKALHELKSNRIQIYGDISLGKKDNNEELVKWKRWYYKYNDIDGFKLNDLDSIEIEVLLQGLDELRKESGKELFSVGEYWCKDSNEIEKYLNSIEQDMSLFDVPLHYNFYEASKLEAQYDLRKILKKTLLEKNPIRTVTFVDNNNTQFGQTHDSWVEEWFKPIAYALILLREEGYPCIFFGDYYGNVSRNIKSIREVLDTLLYVRMNFSYGIQHSYFDNPNMIGWTREGEKDREDSGIAVLISNMYSGRKNMYIGKKFKGRVMYDCTLNRKEEVIIDESGMGDFLVSEKSVSVWVLK